MQSTLKALFVAVALACAAAGCGYAGVATSGDAAVVVRNDWLLFGLLRKVYVCKITPQGLSQCSSSDTP